MYYSDVILAEEGFERVIVKGLFKAELKERWSLFYNH